MRRTPIQSRSQQTVSDILQATAQILIENGRFTTNHVAKRAGVSIGTLYQYFESKDQLLQALAQREAERIQGQLRTLIQATAALPLEEFTQVAIRSFFAMREHGSVVVRLQEMAPGAVELERLVLQTAQAQQAALRRVMEAHRHELRDVDVELASFVVLNAIGGVMAAVDRGLEPLFVDNEALIRELTELSVRYLRAPA